MDTTPLPAPDDEEAHTIGRRSARRPGIELITRGERRRIWTPEQKREIVLESLDPGTTPTAVARKHAISSGLLYTWRQRLLGVQGSPMGSGLRRALRGLKSPVCLRLLIFPTLSRARSLRFGWIVPAQHPPQPEEQGATLTRWP